MGENNRNLTGVLAINAGTDILPTADNFADLGSAAQRFRNVFGVTVNANTLNSGPANTFSVIPRTNNSYDLGSSGLKWRNLYLAGSFNTSANMVPGADNTYDLGSTSFRWKNLYAVNAELTNVNARNNSNTLFTMVRSLYDATFGNVSELRNSAGVNYIQCTENTDNRIVGNVRLFGALSMQGTNGIFFPSYQIVPVSSTGLTIGSYTGTNKIDFSNNSSGTVTITAAGGLTVTGQASVSGLLISAGALPQNDLSWDLGGGSQRWGNLYCAGINATGTVIPNLTLTYDLGSTSKRWNNAYTLVLDCSTVNATTVNASTHNIGSSAGWHFNEIGSTLYCTNTGGVGVNMASGATAWAAVSDRRAKKNIQYLPESGTLTKLLQLKTCYYNYNQDDTSVPPRIGLIGQEVEKVFPDVVNTDPADDDMTDDVGLKSIRYTDLIPYLIKGIQELSARVDVLTAALDKVKKTK